MTIIAFDGAIVASDTQIVAGSYRCPQEYYKLRFSHDTKRVYGMAGYAAWMQAWIDWYEHGANPRDTPVSKTGDHDPKGVFMVFHRADAEKAAETFTYDLPYSQACSDREAWGTGADYALGAMIYGANAIDAVRVAIKATPSCGGYVVAVNLHTMMMQSINPEIGMGFGPVFEPDDRRVGKTEDLSPEWIEAIKNAKAPNIAELLAGPEGIIEDDAA